MGAASATVVESTGDGIHDIFQAWRTAIVVDPLDWVARRCRRRRRRHDAAFHLNANFTSDSTSQKGCPSILRPSVYSVRPEHLTGRQAQRGGRRLKCR